MSKIIIYITQESNEYFEKKSNEKRFEIQGVTSSPTIHVPTGSVFQGRLTNATS